MVGLQLKRTVFDYSPFNRGWCRLQILNINAVNMGSIPVLPINKAGDVD